MNRISVKVKADSWLTTAAKEIRRIQTRWGIPSQRKFAVLLGVNGRTLAKLYADYHRGDMNKLDNLLDLVRFTDDVDILTAAGNEYWKGGTHTFMPSYEYLVKGCIVRKCLVEPSELKSFTDNFEITNSIERTDLYLHTLENVNSPL